MGKIIAVCGKICSGKTYYCNKLKARGSAVLLSCDEILWELFHHEEGDRHDGIVLDIKRYLQKKAAESAGAGCDVILDWGFWKRAERERVKEYFGALGIESEWHYIDINDEDWHVNINERNAKIESGKCSDYYVDDGLLGKFNSLFEMPDKSEIDFWHAFMRE